MKSVVRESSDKKLPVEVTISFDNNGERDSWPFGFKLSTKQATLLRDALSDELSRQKLEIEAKRPSGELYYLQDSRQYVGNDMLFWAKDSRGYTTNLDEAHEFTLKEALSHRETDVPWPVNMMRELSRPAVDMQKLPHGHRHQYKKLLEETLEKKNG